MFFGLVLAPFSSMLHISVNKKNICCAFREADQMQRSATTTNALFCNSIVHSFIRDQISCKVTSHKHIVNRSFLNDEQQEFMTHPAVIHALNCHESCVSYALLKDVFCKSYCVQHKTHLYHEISEISVLMSFKKTFHYFSLVLGHHCSLRKQPRQTHPHLAITLLFFSNERSH